MHRSKVVHDIRPFQRGRHRITIPNIGSPMCEPLRLGWNHINYSDVVPFGLKYRGQPFPYEPRAT